MTMAGTSNSRGKGFKDALSAAGVNEEVQTALTSAFEAMCDWRQDAANQAERHGNKVFDKMGAAAKAMGWPAELVDITRQQMQQASKMKIQVLDQVMDAWEQQVKNPGAGLGMPGSMGSPFQFPNMGQMPGMPAMFDMKNMPDFAGMPAAPLQFWMQAAEMWQKNWQQALSSWMEAQSTMMGGNDKGHGKR
jgi:predicted O-linked N-acetylglucosamine transferase (SPINDLY family)